MSQEVDFNNEKLSEDPILNEILIQERYLKENYKEEDFLKNEKTREILTENFIENFERKLCSNLEFFYERERLEHRDSVSNMFHYDTNGSFFSELKGIIYEHIKPRYNLEILYNSPHLAKHMINNSNVKKKATRESKIIEKKEIIDNSFNWAKNI
jgi:hypothetical protein